MHAKPPISNLEETFSTFEKLLSDIHKNLIIFCTTNNEILFYLFCEISYWINWMDVQVQPYNKMKQDQKIKKFHETDRLSSFMKEINRNGYLQEFKEMTRATFGVPNSFDINYRIKALNHYKKKVPKPFSLLEQPEYIRQKRFYEDFNAFVKSIPQFEKIRQSPVTKDKEHINTQEADQEYLLFNIQKNCDVSPENILKRRTHTTINNPKLIEHDSIFTTKINLSEGLKKLESQNSFQSRSQFNTGIGFRSKSNALAEGGYGSMQTKKKVQNLRRIQVDRTYYSRRTNPVYSHKSNLSSNSKSINEEQVQEKRKIVSINEEIALQNLNQLTGSEHKVKNFRVSKQKLHELIQRRYGQDIITNFFAIQANQDFPGVIKIVKQIILSTPKLAQLLTFLTLDLNQDGVITQDQLMSINNLISINNGLSEDIKRVISYSNSNPNLKCEIDLPLQFIKYPTYKQYLKRNKENKEVQFGSIKSIERLFSFRMEEDEKMNSLFPNITGKGHNSFSKKLLQVNFQHFQKIFQNTHPKFIAEIVNFLIGNSNRVQESVQKKVVSLNSKKKRKFTVSIEPKEYREKSFLETEHSQVSKATQILKRMHRDNKNLTTIQYI